MSATASLDPWRGDVLNIRTANCVVCGKDLAKVLKAKGTITVGGHLCAYGRVSVLAGFCQPCRKKNEGGEVELIGRPGCVGCYGYWSQDRHGAVMDPMR